MFKCFPKNGEWTLELLDIKNNNKFFFILENDKISNNEIYFLAEENILKTFDKKKLKNYNKFTDTYPAYRANFKIYINNGGFSSYQSDYPFSMVTKKGSILSPINSLANLNADKNYVLIKNIFEEPIEENFNAYLVDYKKRKVEKKFILKTNFCNCLELDRELIKPEVFLVTEKYLGIPMFVSIKDHFLSFEHTHPPHEYILGKDKFIRISALKKEINEIIN